MAIGGWKTRSVFDRYNIVSERDLHDAAAKLERHLAKIESAHNKYETSTKASGADSSTRKLLN